jgi:hypothetical protein
MDRAWEIHEQWLQERFDHLGDVKGSQAHAANGKIHQWNPSGFYLKFGAGWQVSSRTAYSASTAPGSRKLQL